MPWTQLTINTTANYAELLSEHLEALGAVSVTFQDSYDTPVFEPLPGETRLWGNTDVIGLFTADTDMESLLATLSTYPLLKTSFNYHIETLADKDWAREWMDNFHPLQFGKRLWICPSWCDIPVPDAVNVMLDPGLAFGTGTHPTTALCLQWLDSLDLTDKTIIDFGCGSGILAIAALKLGAKRAIGIDIDPQALEASLANAKRNQVEQQLTLYLSEQAPSTLEADIVIANILAGPLRELSPAIAALVKPSGQLGLSGILADQAGSVIEAYQTHFYIDPVVESDEWCRITATKHH